MARNKNKDDSMPNKTTPDDVMAELIARMDKCPNAEALNDDIIMPFILALENVCEARGYLMNIYGESSNIAVTTPDDAETIYHLIEGYLDKSTQA